MKEILNSAFNRTPRVTRTRTMGFAGAGAALATSSTAQASVILSPVAVVSNSLADSGANFDIGNALDQSGLSVSFDSGVTDYAAFLQTGPTHSALISDDSFFLSDFMNTSGTIVFDLGEAFSIESLAIWQGGGVESKDTPLQINAITLETSSDPSFTNPTTVGSFNVPESSVEGHVANDFDLTDSVGQFVRLTIDSNHGNPNFTSFGDIAFEVNAIPEPSSFLLLLSSMTAALAAGRLRRQRK